jgi:hypothetical protein
MSLESEKKEKSKKRNKPGQKVPFGFIKVKKLKSI